MVCTTCGHMLFRYALRELAKGQDPTDPKWLVHSDHPDLRRGSPLHDLGPVPPLSGWPVEEQRKLQKVLQKADLHSISLECSFPDWLGYLGLALHYTEDAERESRGLTQAWVPKLMNLVGSGSAALEVLAEIATHPKRSLTWRDLETVESDVHHDA